MMAVSDRYGDLDLEDVEEFEGLEPETEAEIDFDKTFQRAEVRSFEADFGYLLDQTLAELDKDKSEWDEYDEAQAEEDYKTFGRHPRETE